VRSGSAYEVLALQVELCLPRLIASCAEPRWRLLGFRPGSGRRASPDSLLLGAAFRAFSSSLAFTGALLPRQPQRPRFRQRALGASSLRSGRPAGGNGAVAEEPNGDINAGRAGQVGEPCSDRFLWTLQENRIPQRAGKWALAGSALVSLWPNRDPTLKGGFQWRQR
jgi:hypothetical protein